MIDMRKILLTTLLFMVIAAASAAEITVWQGSKQFTGWGDVLNIEGSKLSGAKADDMLHLSITASAGAQLQVSWGSNWTNFDGLDARSISGDYDIVVTKQDVGRLSQGIHIKGVNFTLTAVTLKTNDGSYETLAEDLFAWHDMLLSGAEQGQTCTVSLKPYSGVGWYWQEPKDLSNYGSIVIELLQPAAETMTAQLFYNDKNVKSQNIAKGATQCTIKLTAVHRKAYSVNIISEKAQMVAIGSVNLADKQGNIVPTAVGRIPADTPSVVTMEYYNSAGVRLSHPQHGIILSKLFIKEAKRLFGRKYDEENILLLCADRTGVSCQRTNR